MLKTSQSGWARAAAYRRPPNRKEKRAMEKRRSEQEVWDELELSAQDVRDFLATPYVCKDTFLSLTAGKGEGCARDEYLTLFAISWSAPSLFTDIFWCAEGD